MDPRHPEQAVIRLRDLMLQYNSIESKMLEATTTAQLGQLEREGGLVVQEMCLVAPRIHEAMMQTSRKRRHQLAMGITYVPEEKVGKYTKATIGIKERPVMAKLERPLTEEEGKKIVESISTDKADVIGEENIGGESKPMRKPAAKKTTRKKKTAKKADEECKEK